MWRDQDRDGTTQSAITTLSLTKGCSCLMCFLLTTFSDFLLSVKLKIEGHGTPRVLKGRRGVSLLHDIGLKRSARVLKPRGRWPGRCYSQSRSQLGLKNHPEFSFASDDNNVEKSYSPKGEAALALPQNDSQNIQKSPVGNYHGGSFEGLR